jgi:hypothetical protein
MPSALNPPVCTVVLSMTTEPSAVIATIPWLPGSGLGAVLPAVVTLPLVTTILPS